MSTLNSSGSKDKPTETLTLHTDQPDEQSVLPPFTEELKADDKLKLSHETFKQKIGNSFKHKVINPLSQLTTTPAFPTPHVLAQFASKTYTDYKKRETDAQYETRLALPDGWKLLTTASNVSMNNGYFGAAYWQPKHQQVVIAHRGTNPKNFGALWADFKGVFFNNYVSQMESASTFAHNVVEVLREINRKKGVNFQLFYTGHSLGGWLAQITNFTTKYLKREGNIFLKSDTVSHSYHPHTVVFDSPGCKEMLSKMTGEFDVKLDGRSIEVEHLDITSYLAAPNLINTCNEHVGTVYRIFPDLSDMDWLDKHTALYTWEVHSIDKIVEYFDPETGQVHKDGQGKPKIQVVVDWPVTGLLRSKEYKTFFKSAKHCNNYHPEVKNLTFQLEGYHPIRYQTKGYDERVSRLNVFCQQERQFLESYRWLRQLPEFFKPKELFSVMEDNHAQDDAEKILEGFEIGSDKIRCRDGSELQALIPYVKRLLQLFPKVKESTKTALSSDEIRNRVYQFETRRYIKRVGQSPLEFSSDASSIREFVESEQQQVLHLQMVKGDEWTGLIKIHQVLKKTGCLIEGQYTVLKLKRLLTLNQSMDFSKVMQSTVKQHLLLVACEDNQILDEEKKDVIRTLFDTTKQKPNIKIIFVTSAGGSIVAFLHDLGRRLSGKRYVTGVEQLNWSDLTSSLQDKLLEKSVNFQGCTISLNKLMSAESPVANFLPLCALLEDRELTIADPEKIADSYNEGYYIGRTLRHQDIIKEDISNFPDLIASTEQKFTQLCQENPNNNVHWLNKDKSGKLVWQQTKGSLETVRRYIDTQSSHKYTPGDLDKLLEQAQHQRVMLISDTAGMGKSTVLTHLSKEIKQKFPAKWVVKIELNEHTNSLKALKEEKFDKEKAIKFISEKVLKLKTDFEIELFKQCCEQKQKVRIIMMIDGFDEISPSYTQTVFGLLQALRQTAVEQLWVTTRPHLRRELEDKLDQLSYTLQPFSEGNQIEFLTKFWSLKGWYKKMENDEKEENNKKLEIYAKKLILKLAQSISDKEREFTGIPLQCRMLAEAFDEDVKTFCQSVESIHDLPFKLDLLGLYGRFIERKYDIYLREKGKAKLDNETIKELREIIFKSMREEHQLLALKELFTEEQLKVLQNNRQPTFTDSKLSRIGIAQLSHDGKLHFIHRTIAEYYVADYLVNSLTEGNNTSQQVQTFILTVVFREAECQVIRVFVDGLLSTSKPINEVLKKYGNQIHELWNEHKKDGFQSKYWIDFPLIKHLTDEGNSNIIRFLLDSLQAAEHTDTNKELLLAVDEERVRAWHEAVYSPELQISEKMWDWAKEKLTRDELRRELLLATDRFGKNAWHTSVKWGEVDVLLKQWGLAKQELKTEEINEVLLSTDYDKMTVWNMVEEKANRYQLQKLWQWATMRLTTEEIKSTLFSHPDYTDIIFWQKAVQYCGVKLLLEIWVWVERNLTKGEVNNLLLDKDDKGRRVLHVAAEGYKLEILQKMVEWAKENLTTEEVNKLLLATDKTGRTFLHVGLEGYRVERKEILRCVKVKLSTEEVKSLLLATNNEGLTAWHEVERQGQMEVFNEIHNLAEEILTGDEINKNFFSHR